MSRMFITQVILYEVANLLIMAYLMGTVKEDRWRWSLRTLKENYPTPRSDFLATLAISPAVIPTLILLPLIGLWKKHRKQRSNDSPR